MRSNIFIDKLSAIAQKKTVYMWGTFGALVTEALITSKAKQYPGWYTAKKQDQLRRLIGHGVYAFDCVGLIKGALWGWSGDAGKSNGGALYGSGSVPDISADQMIKRCIGVSADFKNIEPGEAVWMPGHIGVYIRDGLVIESTPAWLDGVQVTHLSQRAWKAHGKLPYIEYLKGESMYDVKVIAGGKTLPGDNKDGKVTVSVRAIAEALGYSVRWDEATRTVIVEEVK